jgi:hypothetical protein
MRRPRCLSEQQRRVRGGEGGERESGGTSSKSNTDLWWGLVSPGSAQPTMKKQPAHQGRRGERGCREEQRGQQPRPGLCCIKKEKSSAPIVTMERPERAVPTICVSQRERQREMEGGEGSRACLRSGGLDDRDALREGVHDGWVAICGCEWREDEAGTHIRIRSQCSLRRFWPLRSRCRPCGS